MSTPRKLGTKGKSPPGWLVEETTRCSLVRTRASHQSEAHKGVQGDWIAFRPIAVAMRWLRCSQKKTERCIASSLCALENVIDLSLFCGGTIFSSSLARLPCNGNQRVASCYLREIASAILTFTKAGFSIIYKFQSWSARLWPLCLAG